jgi:hypothetical protein
MPAPNNGGDMQGGPKMPPEILVHKSNKWIQMQNKRYGEKRKAGFIDVGKQVGLSIGYSNALDAHFCAGFTPRTRQENHQRSW